MELRQQEILEAIEKGVKYLKNYIQDTYTITVDPEFGKSIDITSQYRGELIILISENAQDFTADIAKKVNEKEFNPSEKQAWCLAYQVINNLELYKSLLK